MRLLPFRLSLLMPLLLGVLPLGTLGCGGDPRREGKERHDEASVGSLALALTLPGDEHRVDVVEWEIGGDSLSSPWTGNIEVEGEGKTVTTFVSGLPAGTGYKVTLTATSDGGLVCRGSADFEIRGGEVTRLALVLNCRRGESGSLNINAELNHCAELVRVTVTPLEVMVGNGIELRASARDRDDDELTYSWSIVRGGGGIAAPSAAETTFTCTEVGPVTLGLTVSDGSSCEDSSLDVDVLCVARPVEESCASFTYSIHAIGYEGKASYALALNDLGQVTGNLSSNVVSGALRAFLWTPGSAGDSPSLLELGVLPGQTNTFSRGYSISASGVVVGESDNDRSKAFRWEAGSMSVAGSLNDAGTGVARAINAAGVIAGASSNGVASRAFKIENGTSTELPSLDSRRDTTSQARSINAAGDIVGYSRDASNVTRATLWSAGGELVNLGTLVDGKLSWAFDVNTERKIVGSAIVDDNDTYHAFSWKDGELTDLGTLPALDAARHSEALAVNDAGWAVGYVGSLYNYQTLGSAAAVAWIDGQIYDLNSLLPGGSSWELLTAQDINAHGDIVGYGRLNGTVSAFLLKCAR